MTETAWVLALLLALPAPAADKEKDHFKRNLTRKIEQFIMKTGEITRAGD